MSSLVVYYSVYGNCRFAAEELARRLDAETLELVERRGPRKGLGILFGALKAIRNKPSRLAGDPWSHLRDVDTLWLISPIWASSATPAALSFLEGAHLAGKTVNVVTLQADPSGEGSERAHSALQQRITDAGGSVGRMVALHSDRPGSFAGEAEIRPQIEELVKSATA